MTAPPLDPVAVGAGVVVCSLVAVLPPLPPVPPLPLTPSKQRPVEELQREPTGQQPPKESLQQLLPEAQEPLPPEQQVDVEGMQPPLQQRSKLSQYPPPVQHRSDEDDAHVPDGHLSVLQSVSTSAVSLHRTHSLKRSSVASLIQGSREYDAC